MFQLNRTVIACLMVLPLACQQAPGNSCSATTVVNPIGSAYNSYPAVVLVNNDRGEACSGTFIKDNLLLTAAHCLGPYPRDNSINFNGRASSRVYFNARFLEIYRYSNTRNVPTSITNLDIALVEFPYSVAPATARLSARVPRTGDPVELVGFGATTLNTNSNYSGVGEKRLGRNRIERIYDGLISFTVPTNEYGDSVPGGGRDISGSGPGDSGGPLLLDGDIIGVVHGEGPGGGFNQYENLYVSLRSPTSIDLLRDAGIDTDDLDATDDDDQDEADKSDDEEEDDDRKKSEESDDRETLPAKESQGAVTPPQAETQPQAAPEVGSCRP